MVEIAHAVAVRVGTEVDCAEVSERESAWEDDASRVLLSVFFFFSSRRRHTRFDCDWSSDVCSSDLEASAEVLLLAYVNAEALQMTVDTGQMHFYSRSREEIWRKGETSGATMTVRDRKSVV